MNENERKLLESFKYALNPELLVEEVVNSSIGILQLLPGSHSRMEYKHEYEHPEYYKDSAAFGSEKAPVKEILIKGSDRGVTVMLSLIDRAYFAMGADWTGAGQGPDWAWLKKTDGSQIDSSQKVEYEDFQELGYETLGYKPVTFIVNWLTQLLSKYGGKVSREKISHPKFKSGKYPKGYDIKEIIYFDIPDGFVDSSKPQDQRKAFAEIINQSEKQPWFDVVGYANWSGDKEDKASVQDFGGWFIVGKTNEPGFEMDIQAKADIDAGKLEKQKAKKYAFLDKQFTRYSHRDPFDRFNKKAAKEKWDKSIALISNILSRSGTVKDDRKLTPYYLSAALEKILKEYDPVDFDGFNPENMEEYQANELFGFSRKGIKGIIKDIIMKVDADPSFLRLESTVKYIDSLLEDVNIDNDEDAQMDMALYMHAMDSGGFTRNDIGKMFNDRTKALKALDRLEKSGQLVSKSGKYVANKNSTMDQVSDNLKQVSDNVKGNNSNANL